MFLIGIRFRIGHSFDPFASNSRRSGNLAEQTGSDVSSADDLRDGG